MHLENEKNHALCLPVLRIGNAVSHVLNCFLWMLLKLGLSFGMSAIVLVHYFLISLSNAFDSFLLSSLHVS